MSQLFTTEKLFATNKHPIPMLTSAVCAVLSCGLATSSAQTPPISQVPQAPVAEFHPFYFTPGLGAEPGEDLGFFLNGDLGPSFMPEFQSSRFGFPGSFTTQTGVRLGLEPGYNFLSTARITLGGEFETGVIYNYLSSVSQAGSPTPLRGDYYQVPLLAKLVLQFHPNSFVIPYVGVGAGGDFSEAKIHSPGFFGFENTSDEIDPAVQGTVGVRFRFNSRSDLGLGYKFLAAFPTHGQYLATHALSATFTLRF